MPRSLVDFAKNYRGRGGLLGNSRHRLAKTDNVSGSKVAIDAPVPDTKTLEEVAACYIESGELKNKQANTFCLLPAYNFVDAGNR